MADATTAIPNSPGSPGNPIGLLPTPVGTSTGGQTSQDVGWILSLLSGLGITGNQGDLTKIAQMADPWGPNRGQYATQLNQFMADPSSVLKDPAFIAAQKVGAEDISRQAGAAGMAQSGSRLADLFSFGQSSALDFEKTKFNELSQLAGVNAGDPSAVARLLLGQKQAQGTNLATGLAGAIPTILSILGLGGAGGQGGIAQVIKDIFGGGSTPGFDLSGIDLSGSSGVDLGAPDWSSIGDQLNIGDILPGA